MDNNKTYWIRWLVGILWAGIVLIISIIGNNVIANEKENIKRNEETCNKVEKVKEEHSSRIVELEKQYTRIDTKLEYIDEGIREQKVVNAKILEKLDKLQSP